MICQRPELDSRTCAGRFRRAWENFSPSNQLTVHFVVTTQSTPFGHSNIETTSGLPKPSPSV